MRFIPATASRTLGRRGLLLQKHSPTILFGVGVTSMIGSTVVACRATLKIDGVLNEAEEERRKVHSIESDHPNYSEQDRERDLHIIKVKTALNIGRLYLPAVGLGVAGIAALTQSKNILEQRNAALTAAYVALDEGFKKYRERVIVAYGEDEDRRLRYGVVKEQILNEKGHKDEIEYVPSKNIPSIYARFFDESSTAWQPEAEYNLLFLRAQQNFANDKLHAQGHVFLNEVYDSLGLQRSKAGAVVGWVLQGDRSDNFIDFGVFDGDSPVARDFVNGLENSILLDFNVDGVIYDLLDDKGGVHPR